MRLVSLSKLLVLAVLCMGVGCGGCPLHHSELVSMTPQVDCLDVKGDSSSGGQCVTAALVIKNNCSETLQFAYGGTNNGGKLTFAPGEQGHYDTLERMQTTPNHWETTATLGSQTITFVIKTIRR